MTNENKIKLHKLLDRFCLLNQHELELEFSPEHVAAVKELALDILGVENNFNVDTPLEFAEIIYKLKASKKNGVANWVI